SGDINVARDLPSTLQVFARAHEVVLSAQLDQYHWTRLYSAILPLEPELLAFALVWIGEVRGRRPEGVPLARTFRSALGESACVPLECAEQLWQYYGREDDGLSPRSRPRTPTFR